ncbi:MAG: Uma2 family endonuclease [Spirochaetaceae bacterium]|nr:MAG: Uma2 family endonuclease [Spirochaetaceae bacterium]
MPTFVSLSTRSEYQLLSADEFLDWLEPGKHADLIDGKIEMHSPVSIPHARMMNFIYLLIGQYVEAHELGELFREVVAVKLSSRNVFLPDLAFYAADRLGQIRDTYVDGAPDLVVEVLSQTTGARDIGVKFAEYEQHGVREYWILDPATLAHRFYARDGELLVEFAHGEPTIASRVLAGLVMERAWLDPERLPRVADCLAAIAGRG